MDEPYGLFVNPFQVVGEPTPTAESVIGSIPPALADTITYVPTQMVSPKRFTGRHLAEASWYTFEAIGGYQSLAIWAANNRTKFYTTLFAKMLPQGASPALQDHSPRTFRLNTPVKSIDIIEHDKPADDGG